MLIFRGESVRWSQTPSPLAYAVYAFINVDNCERPLRRFVLNIYNIVHVKLCFNSWNIRTLFMKNCINFVFKKTTFCLHIIHYVNWLCVILGMSLISLFSFRHILFDFSFKKMQCIIIIIDMYESWNKFDCIVLYVGDIRPLYPTIPLALI